jgi:outer membrane protein assembly complex protein YaeT
MKKVMENTESTLSGGEKTYSEFKKKTDIERILYFARWKGYIFARVLRYDVRIDWVDPEFKDKRGYYIEIEIEEGPRYNVGSIDFQGNQLYTDYELKQLLQFKKGDVYDELKFKKTLQSVYDTYRTQGYIYTKVTVIEKYDREKKIVNFLFNIFDGDRAHIETILFRGNTKTKSYVIDRELRIWEGEIFNIARINRSKERINKLGFFKNVNMDIRPSSEEGLVDLIFTLEPQRTGMISVGGGYGTVSGFSGFVEVTENNLAGKGYRISARGEIGQRLREIKLSFGSAYITKYTPISYSLSVGFRWQKRQFVPYYDRNGDGVKDKMIVSGTGNLLLVQNQNEVIARANELGLTGSAYNSFVNASSYSAANPYDGSLINYTLDNTYDEQAWLNLTDYDPNGDGVYSPNSADYYTSDRYYKEYVLFGGGNIGIAFAEYFSVFTGYGLSATKLYTINSISGSPLYYWKTADTTVAGTAFYGSMPYMYLNNIYDATGDKTSFKNALLNKNWLLTSKIPVGFTFDSTDNNFNPTKGMSFKFTWAFNGVGGDVKFNEMSVEINYYIPLPFRLVWANRIGTQMILPWFGHSKPLALEGNKLSFDGQNEARGWQDFAYYDQYIGFGKIVLSTEIRWPIPETKDMLYWVFFFDVAGMNNDKRGSRLPTNIENEYVFSWGFGLRVQIPMLPIRLYGAKRMLWKNGRLVGQGKGLEFVFSIAGYF